MKLDVVVHIHNHEGSDSTETQRLLRAILAKVTKTERETTEMHNTIDDLITKTTEQTTLIGSVGTMIQGLKDELAAQGVDKSKIDAAFQGLTANNAALALLTNTPATDPAVPTPDVPPA